jgi:hypothetical protein
MNVPAEVIVGCAYALVLVVLAAALPWRGRRVRANRDMAGAAPSSGADAWSIYVGSSALLILLAAALVVHLGLRHLSPSVLATTGGIGLVVAWGGLSTWKRWAEPRPLLENRHRPS